MLTDEEIYKVKDYLMVISGSLDLLDRQPIDEQGQKNLRRAQLAARKLAELMGFPQKAS